MKNRFIYLVIPSLLAVGALARAENQPKPEMFDKVGQASQYLDTLSERELQKLFDVKNAKGDSIRQNGSGDLGKEKGIWATGDSKIDGVEGTSTDKLYHQVKVPARGKAVIVAVIDSGVDINHEGLIGKIWSNPSCKGGEVKVVDDGDGFKDDCHGWNFLGGHDASGKNINVGSTTLEVTREYVRLKKRFDEGTLNEAEANLYHIITKDFTQQRDDKQKLYDRYLAFDAAFKLLKANGLTAETPEAVNAIQSADASVIAAKALVLKVLAHKVDSAYIAMALSELSDAIKYEFNTNYDPYSASSPDSIVHDHPEIMDERGYGNNDVMGPDASHGTHVSGIIAANRFLKTGILGQARNVLIMPVRAVPNGDERDKDIGNAIYFAVNHGARVINMSFGKPYSPGKSYVDQAMAYADSKGVLLVHAAGNDGKNTESATNNFPNKKLTSSSTPSAEVKNWIEVGASSKTKGVELPASFSNYGKTSVDLFAPGVDIVSTIPGNKYASFQGTSMASPEVAGVAALMLNLFPRTSATVLKKALLHTVRTYDGLLVNQPADGSGDAQVQVPFASLSATGGIVNAYRSYRNLKARQQHIQ